VANDRLDNSGAKVGDFRGYYLPRKISGKRPRQIIGQLILLDGSSLIQTRWMSELGDILEEIGLSQYLESFIEHGFNNWEAVAGITEPILYVPSSWFQSVD